MDAWLQALLSAIVSGTIVGLVVSVFKVKLDQGVKNAETANDLKIKRVMDELERVWIKLTGMENKMELKIEKLSTDFNRNDMKMAVVVAEHQHISRKLEGLQNDFRSLERSAPAEGFGRVIKKP